MPCPFHHRQRSVQGFSQQADTYKAWEKAWNETLSKDVPEIRLATDYSGVPAIRSSGGQHKSESETWVDKLHIYWQGNFVVLVKSLENDVSSFATCCFCASQLLAF